LWGLPFQIVEAIAHHTRPSAAATTALAYRSWCGWRRASSTAKSRQPSFCRVSAWKRCSRRNVARFKRGKHDRERYVLCVDDEPLLLEGLERTLRESFEVVTETKPLAALALLERKERDFVAIISDMRMPLMDGAKFLACAAEIAPNSTRLLLTGHAELNAAIAAVNTGRVFRFLCKPCAPTSC